MKVRLNNVRLAFPSLFEAKTVNGEGKPAYSATFLLTKDHPDVKALTAAIDKVASEKWGAKAADVLKGLRAAGKTALKDGDTKAEYAGFADNFFVSARNAVRPTVINSDKTPLTESDGKPYGGCYVNAVVELWAQDNSFGKRINASLGGVQFYRDGEAFAGGGAVSADEFDVVQETADDLV